MKKITHADWSRMSWHARQQYLEAQTLHLRYLRHELDRAKSELALIRYKNRVRNGHAPRVEPAAVLAHAQRILDKMTPDPDAAQHVDELLAATKPTRSAA